MIDVAFVRSNSVIHDARAIKILRSLTKRYSTLILGWNREGYNFSEISGLKNELSGKPDGNCDIHIIVLRLQAPIAKQSLYSYASMLIYFPIFWGWILFNLLKYRPKIVHACDLDTMLPCYIYKIIVRGRLVFDVFDRYAMTFIPINFKILHKFVNKVEEFFCEKADVLIAVGEDILSTFQKRPARCTIIRNYAEDHSLDTSNKTEDGPLVLEYAGPVTRGRGLENMALAIRDMDNVQFYIYGPLVDKKLLTNLLITKKVIYMGFLPNEDYYIRLCSADALIALYDPEGDLQQKSYNLSTHNKTFEAMMCGIPIITNVSSDLVKTINYGIIVDYNDITEIKNAILLLRDNPNLRKQLGRNGRQAFLDKYNWEIVEKELLMLYKDLLNK
jgi:glycosyltransferase involved in cell wall biosynthesis